MFPAVPPVSSFFDIDHKLCQDPLDLGPTSPRTFHPCIFPPSHTAGISVDLGHLLGETARREARRWMRVFAGCRGMDSNQHQAYSGTWSSSSEHQSPLARIRVSSTAPGSPNHLPRRCASTRRQEQTGSQDKKADTGYSSLVQEGTGSGEDSRRLVPCLSPTPVHDDAGTRSMNSSPVRPKVVVIVVVDTEVDMHRRY